MSDIFDSVATAYGDIFDGSFYTSLTPIPQLVDINGNNIHVAGTTLTLNGFDLDQVVKVEVTAGVNTDTYEQFNSQSVTSITIASYSPLSLPYGSVSVSVYDAPGNVSTVAATINPPAGAAYSTADANVVAVYADPGNIYSGVDVATSGTPVAGWQVEYQTTTQNTHTVEAVTADGFPTISGGTGADQIIGVRYYNGAQWSGYISLDISYPEIVVSAGNLTLQGQIPVIQIEAGVDITIPSGSLSLQGQTPVVRIGTIISIPSGSVSLSGGIPSLSMTGHAYITVPNADLIVTGKTPDVVASDHIIVTVPQGNILTTGKPVNLLISGQLVTGIIFPVTSKPKNLL